MKVLFILVGLVFSMMTGFGQVSSVYGKIVNRANYEELLYAPIRIEKNGVLVTEGTTDFEGNYSILIDPGIYNIKVSYDGYVTRVITGVIVNKGQGVKLDIKLDSSNIDSTDEEIMITSYEKKLKEHYLKYHNQNYNYLLDFVRRFLSEIDLSEIQVESIDKTKSLQNPFAQQSSIYGKISDQKTGEELLYAKIILYKNGVFVTEGTTDFEGNYSILIDPGKYDLHIRYWGYDNLIVKDVPVFYRQKKHLDIQLKNAPDQYLDHCCSYKIPLIKADATSTDHTITSDQIRNQGTKNINELILNTPGLSIENF